MYIHRRIGTSMAKGGAMLAAALMGLFAPASAAWADEAPTYRVAVLPTWDNHPHNHDYDFAFKRLNMEPTHLLESAEQMDGLMEKLDTYKMLFGPPLFGFTGRDKVRPAPYDINKYVPRINEWVKGGGSLFIVDTNYPAPLKWLEQIDPSLAVGAAHCGGNGPAVATEPLDSILFLPKRAEYGFTWGHMTVPDQANTGWKILSRCGHGEPTLMIKRWGKGIILLSSTRTYVAEFMDNVRSNQQFLALGLEVLESHVQDPLPGANTFSVLCRNATDKKLDGELVLSLTPLTKDAEGKSVASGETQVFRQSGSIEANANGTLSLNCRIPLRGPVRAELKIVTGGLNGVVFDREFVLPPFFAIQSTRHRGIVTTDRRYDTVKFGTRMFPDTENLADTTVRISVWDAEGKKKVAEQVATSVAGQQWVDVPLRRNTPAGTYQVRGEVVNKADDKVIYTDQTELRIIGSEPGLTVFDEDMVMLHDGKPFFPLGIYHVGASNGYTAEFAEVADVGFNTFQTFGWAGVSHIDQLHQLGIKTLWEQMPHRSPDAARIQASNLSGNPGMLMYYTMDEPAESQFDTVRKIDAAYRQFDPNHPTFLASYQPHHFKQNAQLSDVLAPDPYPYSKKREKIDLERVSLWMDRAREASDGNRPYMCVPQAFGEEPPHIWKNMALQAVSHGAKGLIWYAWNEKQGTSGMRYHPGLRQAATELIAQLKSITPAILNHVDKPRQFTAMDYNLHGMVARDPETKTYYLLLAASALAPIEFELEVPELPKDATFIEGAFDDQRLAVNNGKVTVKFDTYGSGIYSWGGPKPVVERPASDFAVRELPARGSGRTLNVVAPDTQGVAEGTFTSIQAALDAAKDGDVIRVGEGVYGPIVSDNKLVDIVATGAVDKTIIDAAGKARCATLTQKPFGDMSWQRNTLLRGFTIRNGNAAQSKFRNTLGGGVIGGTLDNCVITANAAQYGGGAAYADVTNSTLTNNRADKNGGAAAFSKLVNVVASENTATWDGGAFEFCHAERSEIRNNRARRDGGGTHYGKNVSNKIMRNNAARHGGGTSYSDNTHTLIARNTAGEGDGGGVYSGVSQFCTIANNVAGGYGGGVAGAEFGNGWGVRRGVEASIVWDNTSRKEKDNQAAAVFQHMVPGVQSWVSMKVDAPKGLQTVDPKFVNAAGDDYRLQFDSPCIDMGHAILVPRDAVDPDGSPRVQGGAADIGAYEAIGRENVIGDWQFEDAARLVAPSPGGAFHKLTPDATLVVNDGGLVFDGTLAIRPHKSVRQIAGGDVRWWSKTQLSIEFKADAKGGTLLTPQQGKNRTFWTEVDPKSGKLRVVFALDKPRGDRSKEDNWTVFESAGKVTDGKWHQLTLVLDRMGGADGFASLELDGQPVPRVRAGKIDKPYAFPVNPFLIVGASETENYFHGAVKRLSIRLIRD